MHSSVLQKICNHLITDSVICTKKAGRSTFIYNQKKIPRNISLNILVSDRLCGHAYFYPSKSRGIPSTIQKLTSITNYHSEVTYLGNRKHSVTVRIEDRFH